MASAYKPELFTIEDVENYFEISKGNCFRIFAGTNLKADDWARGEYCDGDKNIAAARLQECLISLKQNIDNTNPYTIDVFNLDSKGKQIDKNRIVFQLNKAERYLPYPAQMAGMADNRLVSLMEKQIEQQNLIISKLSAEEDEINEPEEESAIGKLLAKEEVQTMLINGAMNLISGFLSKGVTPPPTYGGGIAGTVDQESVTLLQELFNKGVNNETLQKLNEMSAAKLKSLLMML